ncbi:hypothetical protein SPONN_11 [uncultured Candidatus Thioglobus sp.]|nr:hypothetical protein SPONN_11 [uncultured Candidatus Thioglobus sp.]
MHACFTRYIFVLGNQNKFVSTGGTNVICDIHTGTGYRKIPPGFSGLIFNTDGISPFKSSRTTVWPLMIALSNLLPSVRMNKDNLITIALWVGESKPPLEDLFQPLVQLFGQLATHGIKIKTPVGEKVVKFRPLFGVFDLVAKAPVLNMNQFNGCNGCPTCLHPGSWMHGSRYYLPSSTYQIRTNSSVKQAGEKAESQGSVVDGIKGASVLTGMVDLVKSIPTDYMHCVLEGVTKWLVEKWFKSSSHGSPYYIGRHVKAIDSELLHQRPPHDFSRAPRSIGKHRHHWKANEFRNWLLYYSLPILVSFLPPLYFHHYSLLVCAVHILLQAELTECKVQAAENLLADFYALLPELYGPTSCTLNAHLLVHLTMYVRLWGPLWTHSLFGFESMNGHIKSTIHSKRKVAEQLSFSIDMCHVLGSLADRLFEIESEDTLQFIAPLSKHSFVRKNMTLLSPGIHSIGNMQSSCATQDEQAALNFTGRSILTFKRIYMHDTILYSTQYNDQGKRDSSVCCYRLGTTKNYGIVQKFCFSPPVALVTPFRETASSLLKRASNPCRQNLRNYAEVDLMGAFIIEVHNEVLPMCAIPISSLLSKCVKVSCKDSLHSYVINIPNNYEHH